MNDTAPMHPDTKRTLDGLKAKHEIETAKRAFYAADPAHKVIGKDRDYETHTASPATGEAIRAMIREVCARFGITPQEIGYLVAH